MFNEYLLIEREKRRPVYNSIVYHKNTHNPSVYWMGEWSLNYSVSIWWSIMHSLKCCCKVSIKILKKVNDIMVTKVTHEKAGNFIEYLYYNYAKICIHEQELEDKIK